MVAMAGKVRCFLTGKVDARSFCDAGCASSLIYECIQFGALRVEDHET